MLIFEKWTTPWDPDSVGQDYTFELVCGAGITVVSALVDMVDEESTAPDLATNVSVTAIATGAINGTTQGVTWIPVRIDPDVEIPSVVYARCRYVLSDARGDDFTMRLLVRQK